MAGLKRECGEMFLKNFPLPWERVRVRASGRTILNNKNKKARRTGFFVT